jgi:D-tyrosyl-tRNA(Tyr) deacylase
MRIVIQRVSYASVAVDQAITAEIHQGLLVLLGIELNDAMEDVDWLVQKLVNLRIFSDELGKMNRSLIEINADLLIVSQFTLHASTKKGNRPSFIQAARPEFAIPLYESFIDIAKKSIRNVQTGIFGADMQLVIHNDGPVTIVIDSKNKE